MTDNAPEQRAAGSTGITSPQNRAFLALGIGIFLFICMGCYALYYYTSQEAVVNVETGRVDASKVAPEADAAVSAEYQEATRLKNQERYENAEANSDGVAIPYVFPEQGEAATEDKISDCACQISDEQLIEAIKRVGLDHTASNAVDHKQIGMSDIYINLDGVVVDVDGAPMMFREGKVLLDSNSALISETGTPVFSTKNEKLFLTNKGEIFNQAAEPALLAGDLLTATGQVILPSGQLATRPGNLQQIDKSDIYITTEGQIITQDGRPITAQGSFVYLDDERVVKNRNRMEIEWEGQYVHIGLLGNLVNAQGHQFKKEGILFSFHGIMIKNNGKLERPLHNIKQIGSTDIYLDDKRTLVDGNARTLKHYGSSVRLQSDGKLLVGGGKPMRNRGGHVLLLDKDGNIRPDLKGKGIAQTGVLRTQDGVVYNKSSSLITRRGLLERIGNSDLFTSPDGMLLGLKGRPVTNSEKDVFLNPDDLLPNGAQGLETVQGKSIASRDGDKVYIGLSGKIQFANGQPVKEVGLLVNYDGVAYNHLGRLVINTSGLERVVTKDGKAVTFNGKDVYRGADGRLYDADGNPIVAADGRAVYMDENGNLVDEFGNPITDVELMAEGRVVKNGELATRRALTTPSGDLLYNSERQLFLGANNVIEFSAGDSLTTSDDREAFMSDKGDLIDKDKNVIKEQLLFLADGTPYNGMLSAGREQVITADGEEVLFDGKKVYRGADGALYDENGNPILTADGRKVFMDKDGNLVDKDGNIIDEGLLRVAGKPVKPGDLTTLPSNDLRRIGATDIYVSADGTLLDAQGRLIKHYDKPTRIIEKGQVVSDKREVLHDRANQPLFMKKDGHLINSRLKSIQDDPLANGEKILVGPDGILVTGTLSRYGESEMYKTKQMTLTDALGRAHLYNGERVFVGDDGGLVYGNGRRVTDRKGNAVFIDEMGRMTDKNGNVLKDMVLTNSDGVLIDSDGKLITDGGRLTRIPGTDLYRTADGRVVDANGKPVLIDGKEAYIDEDGRLVDANGRPIKINNKDVYIDENGNLVDSKGNLLTDENGLKLSLSDTGEIINEDGKVVTREVKRKTFTNTTTKSSQVKVVPKPAASEKEKNAGKPKEKEVKKKREGLVVDEASKKRLAQRYTLVKKGLRDAVAYTQAHINRNIEGSYVDIGGAADSGMPPSEDEIDGILDIAGEGGAASSKKGLGEILRPAGSMLYAVTRHRMNTDYGKDVIVDLVGLQPEDPLFGGRLIGAYELKYDNMVVEFSKLVLPTGELLDVKAIALDPKTADAGIGGDVDHHYWYRYGGLFLASLLEGTAEAMGDTGTREESTSITGTRTSTSGLEGDKLVLASLGKVGEEFSSIFAEQASRPSTVTKEAGDDMAVILFESIARE